MIGLSTDAANMGDHTFANLITSIQSDEARHAQLGTPTIEIMIRNGRKKEAQQAMDIALWRVWRLFSITVGIPMDYYIPLEQRHNSFKEFMHEWVINQWERQVQDLGLERPWYWDIFLLDIDNHHHCQQGGIWSAGRRSGGTRRVRWGQGARVAGGEIPRLEQELRQLLGT